MSPQNHPRRIAINRLFTPDGVISPAIVELEGDKIVAYQKLDKEMSFTEWRGGELTITYNQETK